MAAADGNEVVLASTGVAGTPIAGAISYTIPAATTHHVITELVPNSAYTVSTSTSGGVQVIKVSAGGSMQTSANGTLSFDTAVDGSGGLPADTLFGDGFDG
jgi:hypothetical protein